jgi:hypothetical protein
MARERRGRRKAALATNASATVASVAGHPHVAIALKLAGAAAGQFRDRRIERMWSHVVQGMDDPLEFTRQVERALLRDGDDVAHAFVAAAQAAADAVSPSVVSVIGLLARSFLVNGEPNRRVYRKVLQVLKEIDDAEFGALRSAVHVLAEVPLDSPIDEHIIKTTVQRHPLGSDSPDSEWRWFCYTGKRATVLRGPLVPVVVDVLFPLLDETPSSYLNLAERSRERPVIPRSLVDLLVSVMPFEQASD